MPLNAVTPLRANTYKPPAPQYGPTGAAAGGRPGAGGRTNTLAVQGAKSYRDALGLPSYQDLLGKIGNGFGTREYGNAGAAGEGAAFARSELEGRRGDLTAQRADLARTRNDIRNPTQTEGFKNIMRLGNERAGQAAEQERQHAAEAASRRGFVGGYSPESGEKARADALAVAGYEGANQERDAQLGLFKAGADLYGSELGQYGQQLGAYTDLLKTQAELPTKYLDAYSGLLGSLGGDYGSIFGTASKNVQFDTGNDRADAARNRQVLTDTQARLRRPGTQGATAY